MRYLIITWEHLNLFNWKERLCAVNLSKKYVKSAIIPLKAATQNTKERKCYSVWLNQIWTHFTFWTYNNAIEDEGKTAVQRERQEVMEGWDLSSGLLS